MNYQERLEEIKQKSLLELALSVSCLNECLDQEGKKDLKWLYFKNKQEFVKKFKQKFENTNNEVVTNFIRIYWQPTFEDEFLFYNENGDEWKITKSCFMGIYLKESIDHNYVFFLENDDTGSHFFTFFIKH